MKTIFHFKATLEVKLKKRRELDHIFDNIPAADKSAAMKEFQDAWSAPNAALSEISCEPCGYSYAVGIQPESFSFLGFKFKDNDIKEVRIYPDARTFGFKTHSLMGDGTIGLNWTEKEFIGMVEGLKNKLRLS